MFMILCDDFMVLCFICFYKKYISYCDVDQQDVAKESVNSQNIDALESRQVSTNKVHFSEIEPKMQHNDVNKHEIISESQFLDQKHKDNDEDVFEYDFYEPVHEDTHMSEEDEEEQEDEESKVVVGGQYYPIIVVDEELEDFWPEYLAESESEEESEDSNAEDHWANDYPEEEDWEEGEDEENKVERDPYDVDEYNMYYDSEEEEEWERRQR
eukprot:TRINITY_DN5598_c0_g1_i9.p3 TRINITY_DN5598_c0_g1~~TRINITY_DN5598_c0_g1_i9.p3  ORF type:complete len:212 (-),score=60.99 TRINITY_DN5598_c0_g1_i9:291-926(-)